MQIIAATQNKGKIREISSIMSEFQIISLRELDFEHNIPETGNTFQENAEIKALVIYQEFHSRYHDAFILADDSGLEVDVLNGRPGVYSARYAGEKSSQEEKIVKLLSELKNVPENKRTARFVCSMVLVLPDGKTRHFDGFCEGRIALNPKGSSGFGYDPVFLVKEKKYLVTMAELSEEEKNRLSHRAKALMGIKNILGKETEKYS